MRRPRGTTRVNLHRPNSGATTTPGSSLTQAQDGQNQDFGYHTGYRRTWELWEAPRAESLRKDGATPTGQTRTFSGHWLSGQTPAVTTTLPGVTVKATLHDSKGSYLQGGLTWAG